MIKALYKMTTLKSAILIAFYWRKSVTLDEMLDPLRIAVLPMLIPNVTYFSPRPIHVVFLGDIQNWLNGPVGRFLYSDGEDFDFKLLLCHPNVHSKVSIVMKNKWIWPRIQSPGDLTAIRGYKDTHTGWKNPRVWIWACVFFTSNDLKRF